jgi:hypothetical protein
VSNPAASAPASNTRSTRLRWAGVSRGGRPWGAGAQPAGSDGRRRTGCRWDVVALVPVALRPGYLPVPLVIGMLPFASLLLAGVADTAWGHLGPRTATGTDIKGGAPQRTRTLGPILVAVTLAVAVVVVGPQWWQRDRDLMTVDQDRPFPQAEACIAANVPHQARLLVDDALWVDLVMRGYSPGQVVWFYKLDTDRDIQGRYPRGWREFDYLVSTATLRSFPDHLPQAGEAQRRSKVVASFGRGSQRVEIRKVRDSPL